MPTDTAQSSGGLRRDDERSSWGRSLVAPRSLLPDRAASVTAHGKTTAESLFSLFVIFHESENPLWIFLG